MTQRCGDTLLFRTPPVIAAQAAVGGKKEGEGPLAAAFDELSSDNRFGQSSWEAAEKYLQLRAARLCLQKAQLPEEKVRLVLAGDLQAQCTASGYAMRELGVPFAGVFGACSTMAETLGLGEELPPINFADFNSVLLTILGASLNGSIALIALILLVMLAWNYLKLLFEAAERYVLLGVLVYTAPMAFSMGGSMNTINIFRSWCRMLGGQIFMILMNVWCLRIFTSMFANFIANPLQLENGNFLIWFLCAIGFLKISQKIDNFMQMLGINVGRTGSAMLGEAAIAMKSISAAGKTMSGGGGTAGGGSYMASGSETILQGGLAGVVGRQFHQNAIRNITGKSDSIASNIARSVYNSSVRNGGGFSANIIGQVAKGDIARTGSIKGEDAVQAFQSYMGIDRANHTKETVGAERNPASAENTAFDNQSTHSDSFYEGMQTSMEQVLAEYQQNIGMEPLSVGTELSDDSHSPFLPDHQTIPLENRGVEQAEYFTPSVDSSAQYSHIEIGGGRIMGTETSKELGGSLKFAMYSTDKYMPPTQGDYKTVTAVDGSKWYHQYAQPTVVKEPFMKENGEIQYKEHIENKLPDAPKRKNRI